MGLWGWHPCLWPQDLWRHFRTLPESCQGRPLEGPGEPRVSKNVGLEPWLGEETARERTLPGPFHLRTSNELTPSQACPEGLSPATAKLALTRDLGEPVPPTLFPESRPVWLLLALRALWPPAEFSVQWQPCPSTRVRPAPAQGPDPTQRGSPTSCLLIHSLVC